MNKEQKRKRLIVLLKNLSPEMKRTLAEIKRDSKKTDREDFIWHALLCSIATLGNERGYQGLIANEENYNKVSFLTLSKTSQAKRLSHIEKVLRDAKVRMPAQKARWLFENHKLISDLGGVERVTTFALSLKGRETKMRFLKTFHGVGDKYARNIWMDVFDKDFRDSMAIDLRINQVTATLGYEFKSYEEHENFYQGIAKECGLLTWEVDRLLYNFKVFFITGILGKK